MCPRRLPGRTAGELLGEEAGLNREDACTLCSLAVDFPIKQSVNGLKVVHGMLRKALINR